MKKRNSMKPKDEKTRSVSTSRRNPLKSSEYLCTNINITCYLENIFVPTKILRKLYEAKAKQVPSTNNLIGNDVISLLSTAFLTELMQPHTISEPENGKQSGMQLKLLNSEHSGLQFHTPFKIDRALLKLIQYHQSAIQTEVEAASRNPR